MISHEDFSKKSFAKCMAKFPVMENAGSSSS